MKKIYTLTAFALLSVVGIVNAQQLLTEPAIKKDRTIVRCYTYEAIQHARALNPSAETDAQFEAWMSGQIAKRKAAKTALVNYTLPIVFHIINAGEAIGTTPNIAQNIVQAQIIMLNQAYANQVGSPYAVAANTGLQFALAQKNPSGVTMAEPGIDRIDYNTKGWTNYNSTTTPWTQTYIDGTVKPQSYWDPTKYINVWVMPSINSGALVGYATFPTSSGLTGISSTETAATAGVAIITSSIGSSYTKSSCDPTDPYTTGKSLVHELGHFFGLRHIWGDVTCGDDFCNDTPTSEASNFGVYYHPKADACGTPDEMFENYMDYTDDVLLNTFTADQVARIQTVMVNSPRRNTLASSTGGFVPVPGSNSVAFIDYCVDSTNVFETGVKSSGNQYFKDVYVNISTEGFASANGVVSFTTSGTAVDGVDYQILAPTVNFAAGDATKSVVLRIYDNEAVDGDKKIILGLNISGPGITTGTAHQTLTINIIDDDNIKIGQNSINLLDEHFETGAQGWTVAKSATPYVNQFTISANGNATSGATGSGLCAHVTNNTTSKPNIYTRGTAGRTYLQSPLVDAMGVQALGNLSFKYKIRGRGTSASPLDYGLTLYYPNQGTGLYYWGATTGLTGRGPYLTNGTTPIANAPNMAAPAALAQSKFNIIFYFVNSATSTVGDPGLNIDDVVLSATPFPIETAVSNSYSYPVPGTLMNNFRSTNKNQILAISNATASMDGVVASVSQAGVGQVAISTEASGAYMRSQKVVTIVPATPSAANYTATLYFTAAEIAIWGTDKASLLVMQVNDGVDIFGNLNPSNAKLLTPTVTDNLTTDGYISYTVTTTGSGQFVVVSPATLLPLKLVNFSGVLKNNVTNLKWNTSNEVTTKGFDVERSTDGQSYKAIGFVKGQNNASNEYAFNDEKIVKGNKYFYRLKMIDIDGKFNYSNVVIVTFIDKDKWFTVYPSPVKDVLFIQNNTAASQSAEIIITEVSGKIVYKHTGAVASKLEVPVSGWSAGTYVVKIKSNETETTMKIVKQ